MRKILLLLFVTGCTPHMMYSPNLVGTPTDKYYADEDACKHEQFYGNYTHAVTQSLIEPGRLWQRPEAYDQIDDCLRKKGYKIAAPSAQ